MGGNVFKGKTDRIKREDIPQTLDNYYGELSKLFPKKKEIFKYFKPVGSVGKKPTSGDIDLAIDLPLLVDKNFSDESIKEWGVNPQDVKDTFEKMKKRAKTATDSQVMLRAFLQELVFLINKKTENIYCDEKKVTAGNIFSLYPQYDENGNKLDVGVQIDWMVGDLDWLEFSYYSEEYKGNVKGLHRTQLILSMFQNLGMTFKHADGVISKETREVLATKPEQAIKVLNDGYKIKLTKKIMDNYFELVKYIEKNLDKSIYESILNTYLKILDSTRCDVPDNLQKYWKDNKGQLGLKGKFLPADSNLLKEERMPTFKQFLSESKATPQLKNLKKDELINFLDSFLFNIDDMDVTEKLAGQMLKTKYDAETNEVFVAPKAIDGWKKYEKYKFHQDVVAVLEKWYKKQKKSMSISFEVMSEKDVHDYINYTLDSTVVVDFTGVLKQKDKDFLNKIDKNIRFVTKEDIRIRHTEAVKELQHKFRTKWKTEIENTKTLKELRELILPEIQSELGNYIANEFKSVINSSDAVEGIFLNIGGKGMKIPNKTFSDLQRINVGVVNIMKMSVKSVKERIVDHSDRLVTDMVHFLEKNIEIEIDDTKYKRLLSVNKSKEILDKYNKSNDTLELYTSLRKELK